MSAGLGAALVMVTAGVAGLAVAATAVAAGVGRVLRHFDAPAAEPDAEAGPDDLCGHVHAISGAVCDLPDHDDDIRHYNKARHMKWGAAHLPERNDS